VTALNFAWTLLGHFCYSDPMKTDQAEASCGGDNESVRGDDEEKDVTPRKRKTKADIRAEVEPVAPLDPSELGVVSEYLA
jgi:hypothetical protein